MPFEWNVGAEGELLHVQGHTPRGGECYRAADAAALRLQAYLL